MTDPPGSLAAALAALQADLPHIGKDAAAIVPTKTGGTYGYKYADLATITKALMPRMAALGLSFSGCPTMIDGQFMLAYRLVHMSGDSDERSGFYPLPQGTPQAVGSAITYARRYTLCAVTGVAPDEDDDDGQASEREARAELAALRRLPPETDAHGAITEAEIARTMYGPEPGAWRATSTAENDPWYDAPEQPAQDPGQRSATAAQLKAIHAKYGEMGIKGRDVCLATTRRHLGLDVLGSHSDLTRRQAGDLLGKLQVAAAVPS